MRPIENRSVGGSISPLGTTHRSQMFGRAAATLTKTQWLLEFAYPSVGSRLIAKIFCIDFVLPGVLR
jgi:hypothetical protein